MTGLPLAGSNSDRTPAAPASSVPTLPLRDCALCPRLAAFRAAQRQAHPDWFNAPVPPFGGGDAELIARKNAADIDLRARELDVFVIAVRQIEMLFFAEVVIDTADVVIGRERLSDRRKEAKGVIAVAAERIVGHWNLIAPDAVHDRIQPKLPRTQPTITCRFSGFAVFDYPAPRGP